MEDILKTVLQVLIDIEGYLLDGNKDECLDYVLKLKKEIIGDMEHGKAFQKQ